MFLSHSTPLNAASDTAEQFSASNSVFYLNVKQSFFQLLAIFKIEVRWQLQYGFKNHILINLIGFKYMGKIQFQKP